jgi:tetratricopeptide (TPR) repeat protein
MKAKQNARVEGDHNIVVQARGDGIEVQVGVPHLTLVPPRNRLPRKSPGPVDLLNPYRRSIALVGRDTDMQSLWDWLHSQRPIAVRTLAGRAGAGKTRIAIELIERLNNERAGQWFAGFVTGTELRRFHQKENLSQWNWARPTLVVVDYAASLVEPLRGWLSELAQHPGHLGRPLRLLLLEREAAANDGWLQSLARGGHSDARLLELFDPLEPKRLDPLESPEHRRKVLAEMLAAAGKLSGRAPTALPAPGANPRFDRQLAQPVWEDPLYLMMAALLSFESDLVEVLDLPRTELAMQLVDHEVKRLTEGAASPSAQRLLEHAAAFATLGAGLTHAQALEVVVKAAALLGLSCPDGPGALVGHLHNLLPGPEQGIAPIVPDTLAEALLLRALSQCPNTTHEAFLLHAVKLLGPRVVPFVIRTAQDFASDRQPLPLDWLQLLIRAGQADDLALLAQIEAAMPQQTLVLREKALEVNQLLLEHLKRLPRNSEQTLSQLAGFSNNLSLRLRDLGRREEALAQTLEAVRLHRQLARTRPDAFVPDLAMSLDNLANMLSNLGRREEALAQVQEAVGLYHQLARTRPEAFLPGMAISLHNLAKMLSHLGRREEAVRLYHQLAQVRPDAFLPNLAASLNNLANMLSELGRREEALAQAQEAVRIRRQLAQARPDAFLPDLAISLNTLAKMLSYLRQTEEALAAAQETVRLHGQLAQARPDAFLSDLAISLNTLAITLSDLGRREEALAQAQEAVRLHRKLAQARLDAFLPDLAVSLSTLANMLSALERREEALAQAQEALRIRRQLAQGRPDAFLPDLAMSLNNLAVILSALGQREEALAQAHEAVQLYRQLAQVRPDAFLPYLARSLLVHGHCLTALDRHSDAIQATTEAIRLLAPSFAQVPTAFTPLMRAIVRTHLDTSEAAQQPLDMDLLGPVLEVLSRLDNPPADE